MSFARVACPVIASSVALLSIALGGDWPMYQHDAQHSGCSADEVSPPLRLAWKTKIGLSTSQPIVAGGRVYSGTVAGEVLALRCADGRLLWKRPVGDLVAFSCAYAAGTVYVGACVGQAGRLVALAADTGEEKWRFAVPGRIWSSPIVAEGRVFFGCNDGRLYSLDATTGRLLWSLDRRSAVWCSPAYYAGKVYGTTYGRTLFCADARTGALLWQFATAGPMINNSPVIRRGRLYVATHMQFVLPGGLEGLLFIDGFMADWPRFLMHGQAAVNEFDKTVLYCLDAKTGRVFWRWKTPQPHQFFSFRGCTPCVANGRVYLRVINNGISPFYVLGADNGAVISTDPCPGLTPAHHVADNSYACASGKLFGQSYCYDARNGAFLSRSVYGLAARGRWVVGGPPAIADGRLYLNGWPNNAAGNRSGCEGYLYAFTSAEEQP